MNWVPTEKMAYKQCVDIAICPGMLQLAHTMKQPDMLAHDSDSGFRAKLGSKLKVRVEVAFAVHIDVHITGERETYIREGRERKTSEKREKAQLAMCAVLPSHAPEVPLPRTWHLSGSRIGPLVWSTTL